VTDCWDEFPENRPDFGTIRARLKKMKDGKYVLGNIDVSITRGYRLNRVCIRSIFAGKKI